MPSVLVVDVHMRLVNVSPGEMKEATNWGGLTRRSVF
jgi:hypothetical protein